MRWRAARAVVLLVFPAFPAPAALARDARFTPARPHLGDAVSIFIPVTPGSPAPVVSVGTHTYPAFDLGNGRHRAFLPLSPLDKPGRLSVKIVAGSEHTTLTIPVASRRFGLQRIRLPKDVATVLDPVERARIAEAKTLATEEKHWSGVFRAPAGGRMSSPYGVRRYLNGVFLADYYHRGIDFASGEGARVVAPAAGRVVVVGFEHEGFRVHGNTVALDHGHGVVSFFLHLSRILVAEGADVAAGDAIGLVGGTGASTAPHLHWGLYVNGVSIDPTPWMTSGIE
jgi:murein DD-endopeptidase MepM/ murein hydrolase activator NlpD